MLITAWTQNADFQSEDIGEVTLEEAVSLVRSFDWDVQWRHHLAGFERGDETCPPGVGFIGGKNILHLYEPAENEFFIHLDLEREGKLLGFIPKPAERVDFQVRDLSEAEDLLKLFFEGDLDQLRYRARQGDPLTP